jgi:hypothetical protein
MFKTLKGSSEKFVVVKSAKGDEGNDILCHSQEDGNATIETNSTAAKADAVCVDIEMERYDPANWPDLLVKKMTDMLVERGPVQISGSDYDFPKLMTTDTFLTSFRENFRMERAFKESG